MRRATWTRAVGIFISRRARRHYGADTHSETRGKWRGAKATSYCRKARNAPYALFRVVKLHARRLARGFYGTAAARHLTSQHATTFSYSRISPCRGWRYCLRASAVNAYLAVVYTATPFLLPSHRRRLNVYYLHTGNISTYLLLLPSAHTTHRSQALDATRGTRLLSCRRA